MLWIWNNLFRIRLRIFEFWIRIQILPMLFERIWKHFLKKNLPWIKKKYPPLSAIFYFIILTSTDLLLAGSGSRIICSGSESGKKVSGPTGSGSTHWLKDNYVGFFYNKNFWWLKVWTAGVPGGPGGGGGPEKVQGRHRRADDISGRCNRHFTK